MVDTHKKVFTTGEAAKIMRVSQQTVIRCFDNGTLKGFKVPGSKFRRIPRESLFSFMEENGIPTDFFKQESPRIMLWGERFTGLEKELADRKVQVQVGSGDSLNLGLAVTEFRPLVLVLRENAFDAQTFASICSNLKSDKLGFTTQVALLLGRGNGKKLSPDLEFDARIKSGSNTADAIFKLLDVT